MRKLAAIDIGTNSIRILGVSVEGSRLIPIIRKVRTARLGHGLEKSSMLDSDAISRTEDIIREFLKEGMAKGIDKFFGFATSAVRDAVNKEYFLKRIKSTTGLDVEVLSGNREAELSFKGATHLLDAASKNIIVVDIGGGSTEVIKGKKHSPEKAVSLNIGAVRLTERFIHSDPAAPMELQAMKTYLRKTIEVGLDFLKEETHRSCMVGVGGSITTLAAVHLEMHTYNPKEIHGCCLYLKDIKCIMREFLAKNIVERKKIPGLPEGRADIIPAGTQILITIMEFLDTEKIVVSDNGILVGYILSLKNKVF